jgi:hypothetical protein
LQDGRYGKLVPVGDAAAMAAAIESALDQTVDRKDLIRRGFDYTAERAAMSLLEILADLGAIPFATERPALVASG